MTNQELFTSIDIGSSRIKAVIGSFDEYGKLHVLGIGVIHSYGIRKGNILDMDEFRANIDEALAEAEKMSGEQVLQVYVSISGTGIHTTMSRGVIAIPGMEVSEDDVNRALDMSQNGIDLMNRHVLKVIPETFTLDLEEGVKNPVGMTAKKLEVVAHIFSLTTNIYNNVRKGLSDVGVDVVDIYPSIVTTQEAVLSKRQKELGVLCIDIGASCTNFSVYEEGVMKYSGVVPIGGENVTSDIALGVRVSVDLAERLKLEYAEVSFDSEEGKKDEDIFLEKLDENENGSLSKRYLGEIVRARYIEIFEFINDELRAIGKEAMLPEGVVLTGGGAKVPGLLLLAKEILKLPAMIGIPEKAHKIEGANIADPSFASSIGTLFISMKYASKSSARIAVSFGNIWDSLRGLFRSFFP